MLNEYLKRSLYPNNTASTAKNNNWGISLEALNNAFGGTNTPTNTGNSNPSPPPPPDNGLTKWFAEKGNMNMLGAGAVGVNMLAGLASTLSDLDTANKQRKLLKQQLEHNRSVMNNRKNLINQLKGSY